MVFLTEDERSEEEGGERWSKKGYLISTVSDGQVSTEEDLARWEFSIQNMVHCDRDGITIN